MHFPFSAVAVIWTLTFAGLLVLLVVLLGRDRASRFPWFTASMVLLTVRMLASRLLYQKVAPLTSGEIFLTLSDIGAILSLMVVVEVARRAFGRVSRKTGIAWTLIVLAIGVGIVVWWGPWPAAETVFARSTLADLQLMQMAAQKTDLLADLLIVELCVLVVFTGRRYGAGWRSHAQQIAIGLSTASIAQLAERVIMEAVTRTPPRTQDEYARAVGLQEKLFNATSVVFLLAIVWWIVCLWIDEPGAKDAAPLPGEIPPADETGVPPAEIRDERKTTADPSAPLTP
jgi:hypothetical protein